LRKRQPGKAETISVPEWRDEASFNAFYSDTAPKLWSYIRRGLGDGALADDILQETFYRFIRADLPKLERAQMKAYLYRTAASLIADYWRRSKREQRWSFKTLFGRQTYENIRPGETPGAEVPVEDAGAAAQNTGLDNDVICVFERLKPREQALLWLAYVEGFDHREIALALQLREKSISVLLFRARKKFASFLTKEGLVLEEGL
jgi:RNA polymerase sigma-70 factor (ECF subfamily)